jgi:hypothetical protein
LLADQTNLKTGVAILAGALSTEHFFTVTLSSVGATKKFFRDSDGVAIVNKSLVIAAVLSFGLAISVDIVLGTFPATLVTAAILTAIFVVIYQAALGKGPLAGWL